MPDSIKGIRLTITKGFASPASVDVWKSEATLGRDPKATLRFDPQRDTGSCRGIHVRLLWEEDDWWIECMHESGVGLVERNRVTSRLSKGERSRVRTPATYELGKGGPRFEVVSLAGTIPVTKVQPVDMPQSNIPTSVVTKAHRAPKLIAALAILIAALGGSAWYLNSQTAKSVQSAQGDIDTIQGTLQLAQGDIDKVQGSLQEVESRVGDTESAVNLANERIDKAETRTLTNEEKLAQTKDRLARLEIAPEKLRSALLKASNSIFLVGRVNKSGEFIGIGTAWAVGPHQLATNAHVALGIKNWLKEGTAVARHSGNQPHDIKITGTQIHPGYARWGSHLRAARFVEQAPIEVSQIPMCDVAIIETNEDVSPPLQLATDDDLQALRQGDEVGYVGFPMENIIGAFVNPEPLLDVGHLTHLVDMFGEKVPYEQSFVLGYDLNIAGGASGSPIITPNGKVIGLINSGSVVNTSSGDRIPIGFSFGQRVDLLRELIDSQAETNQVARNKDWEKRIHAVGITSEASVMLYVYEYANQIKNMRHAKEVKLQIVGNWETDIPEIKYTKEAKVTLDPGDYIYVSASDAWTDVDVFIKEMAGGQFMVEPYSAEPKQKLYAEFGAWENTSDVCLHFLVQQTGTYQLQFTPRVDPFPGEKMRMMLVKIIHP